MQKLPKMARIAIWAVVALVAFFIVRGVFGAFGVASRHSILVPIAVVAGGYLVYRLMSHDQRSARDKFTRFYLDWRKTLGSSKEERTATIEAMFDARDRSVSAMYWGHKPFFAFCHISRSLATMDNREREFLRVLELMHADDDGAARQEWTWYKRVRFGLIWGDGKATINECNYSVPEAEEGKPDKYSEVKDWPSLVRFLVGREDMSVDACINEILGQVESGKTRAADAHAITKHIRGGHTWFDAGDIEGSIFVDGAAPAGLRLGMLDGSEHLLGYAGEGSLITIAPPGSGKTQCLVLPNMLRWTGPAVVLDVKGEIYAATSKWRAENVGPVFKFSPLDPAGGHCYNPLAFVRQDPEYIWEDSRFLADMLIVPSGASDPFWENMARDVLTAAIADTSYHNAPEDRPMTKVMDLLYGIGWDDMIASLSTNLEVSAMRQNGHSLGEMEKKTRDSVLKTAQSSMSAWQGERIARASRKSDWSPLDLRSGSPTIYICINPNEIDSYLSILRVVIAQHIRVLTSSLPARDAQPVLFMLDELPRLRKMPPVEEALNIGRQYGIRLWMFTQSYGQLKEAYPNAEGMLGSCAVRTFMNVPVSDEIAQRLSDQIGYREGPLDANRVKVVEPADLGGPDYRDLILVQATNTKPIRIRKGYAWQDPAMTALMGSL